MLELVPEFGFSYVGIIKSIFIIEDSLQQKLFDVVDGYRANLSFTKNNDDRSYFPLEEVGNPVFFSFRLICLFFSEIVKDILE